MRAGELDRRVTIQRATSAVDAYGAQRPGWADVATVWASKQEISDAERWRAGEVAATVTTRFRIRWGIDVQVTDRLVFQGVPYEISAVKEIGRREGQEITAAARAEG